MSKVATKPRTLTAVQSYDDYSKKLIATNASLRGKRAYKLTFGEVYNEDGTLYISYPTYKKILSLYFIKAGVKLINGYAVDLEHGLGHIFIMRQGRNPAIKPRLNKGESFKLKKQWEVEGKEITADNWKVYYMDEEFTRTNWFKPSFIKNLIFYKFSPAAGQPGKGFKQTMSRAISSKPSLLSLYPFVSYQSKFKKDGLQNNLN
jgi:hypothetical protein